MTDNPMFQWAKAHAWPILVSLLAVAASWGAIKVENRYVSKSVDDARSEILSLKNDVEQRSLRIGSLESSVLEHRWVIEQLKKDNERLTLDNRVTQQLVNRIEARLDVIGVQINYITETLKAGETRRQETTP